METRPVEGKGIGAHLPVPPSGGSLEIGNESLAPERLVRLSGSPFGGIPRNWKLDQNMLSSHTEKSEVPPSGGSLEIGNLLDPLPPWGVFVESARNRRSPALYP